MEAPRPTLQPRHEAFCRHLARGQTLTAAALEADEAKLRERLRAELREELRAELLDEFEQLGRAEQRARAEHSMTNHDTLTEQALTEQALADLPLADPAGAEQTMTNHDTLTEQALADPALAEHSMTNHDAFADQDVPAGEDDAAGLAAFAARHGLPAVDAPVPTGPALGHEMERLTQALEGLAGPAPDTARILAGLRAALPNGKRAMSVDVAGTAAGP